jgi:hypothetical protein
MRAKKREAGARDLAGLAQRTNACHPQSSFSLRGSMNKARLFTASLFLALCGVAFSAIGSAAAKEPCEQESPCGKPTAWQDFNVFTLTMRVPNDPGSGTWNGQFSPDTFDLQIDVDATDGKKSTKGTIIMIGGRVMATRGLDLEPGYEIDSLDGPVLYFQLVTRLLGAALPDGPSSIQGTRLIDHSNKKTGIQFATPSASGFISPPWRVKGSVKTVGVDVVEYQLALTSGVKGKSDGKRKDAKPEDQGTEFTATFSGRLSKLAHAGLKDDMPLTDWKLYGVGVQIKKSGTSTMYDYGAAPEPQEFKTVADVRKKIAGENDPGEPDPSMNFTGFWKAKCEDAFGLQIKPYESTGKYSVVFCGPGGCGEPGESRLTYINKDKKYQVVSADEIREGGNGGDWSTYHKCTTDTNPVLKY